MFLEIKKSNLKRKQSLIIKSQSRWIKRITWKINQWCKFYSNKLLIDLKIKKDNEENLKNLVNHKTSEW